jgi:hypothetical protein
VAQSAAATPQLSAAASTSIMRAAAPSFLSFSQWLVTELLPPVTWTM